MINISILGVGRYGRLLLRQFKTLSHVESYCLQDLKKSINKSFMDKEHPDVSYMSEDEILKSEEIDAVIIATPIKTHYELTKKFLESGKHVFVEKPLSTKYDQAIELDKIAKDKNLVLFVGNKFLYHPLVPIIKELDKIHSFGGNFIWKKEGTYTENIFWNLIIHDLTLCIELFGTPNEVKITKKYKDIASLLLKYDNRNDVIIDHNRVSSYYKKSIELLSTTNKGKNYQWISDKLIYLPTDHISHDYGGNADLIYLETIKFLDLINKNQVNNNSVIIEAIRILDKLGL